MVAWWAATTAKMAIAGPMRAHTTAKMQPTLRPGELVVTTVPKGTDEPVVVGEPNVTPGIWNGVPAAPPLIEMWKAPLSTSMSPGPVADGGGVTGTWVTRPHAAHVTNPLASGSGRSAPHASHVDLKSTMAPPGGRHSTRVR